jgi:hypothetical protein
MGRKAHRLSEKSLCKGLLLRTVIDLSRFKLCKLLTTFQHFFLFSLSLYATSRPDILASKWGELSISFHHMRISSLFKKVRALTHSFEPPLWAFWEYPLGCSERPTIVRKSLPLKRVMPRYLTGPECVPVPRKGAGLCHMHAFHFQNTRFPPFHGILLSCTV